jgi:hypothetical protein
MTQSNPDYRPKTGYRNQVYSLSRKRQIIDAMVDDLHEQYFDMIEQAVELSDLAQAREVIDYIRTR